MMQGNIMRENIFIFVLGKYQKKKGHAGKHIAQNNDSCFSFCKIYIQRKLNLVFRLKYL